MSDEIELAAATALVQVSPGTALVFGEVPSGLDFTPFSLVPAEDREAIVNAVASSSSILNVGGQVASAFAHAQGLVRLAPETIQAMQAGATAAKSGGYFIGTLSKAGKFSDSIRWLPATGANAAGVIASLGPALAMIAIQVQLSELTGIVRQNLALTETVLKSVRNQQWAELTGLEQAMSKAIEEANKAGAVTAGVWQNVSGREADLRKQRDLFRRNSETHIAELEKLKDHKERRKYIEKNGEALILDLHCWLLAHKAWFEYQALRAGHLRLTADADAREAKLLETIMENAGAEHDQVGQQLAALLDRVSRELWILAELPGKRTLPFTGGRRSAKDVAKMADQLLEAVRRLSPTALQPPPEPAEPDIIYVEDPTQVEQYLRVLRWHLDPDERLVAIAVARQAEVGALEQAGAVLKGVGTAVWHGPKAMGHAVVEPGVPVLIAVTDRRVVVADLEEFRQQGMIIRSVAAEDVRIAKIREAASGRRVEMDFVTSDAAKETWRFARGSASAEQVKALGDLLSNRIDLPTAALAESTTAD